MLAFIFLELIIGFTFVLAAALPDYPTCKLNAEIIDVEYREAYTMQDDELICN